jgi:hypothetical protein
MMIEVGEQIIIREITADGGMTISPIGPDPRLYWPPSISSDIGLRRSPHRQTEVTGVEYA